MGASPRRLLADVVRDGVLLTVLGVAIGLGVSAMLARAVSAIIFGVAPRDPLTYGVTAAAVLVVALAACYLPARRAAASDPVVLASRRVAEGHTPHDRERLAGGP